MGYSADIKIADVVSSNPVLLSVLERLGIRLGFGEATVEQICLKYGFPVRLFLTICNVYTYDSYKPSPDTVGTGDVLDLVGYLQESHRYYLKKSFPHLHRNIHRLVEKDTSSNKEVLNRYYDEYDAEVTKHFDYEEKIVFPYIRGLVRCGAADAGRGAFSIRVFEHNHSNIEEKLADLRNIVMKYLPSAAYSNSVRMEVLREIFAIEKDLYGHTLIEDRILVPAVIKLEEACRSAMTEGAGQVPGTVSGVKRPRSGGGTPAAQAESKDTLSEREKEIIVLVAKGRMNKEIADILNISMFTVMTHRKNISKKLGINNIAGLAVYAIINGLVDISSLGELKQENRGSEPGQ